MKEEKIPSLTEKIRIFALGGLDEDGKNLFCVEVDESIYVIAVSYTHLTLPTIA